MSSLQSSNSPENQYICFTEILTRFVSKFESCHNVSATPNLHQWTFLLGFENKRKYGFHIESKIKNHMYCFCLTLSLKEYWDEAMKSGSEKIRDMVNLFNLRKNEIFIHEFQESSKAIITRTNMLWSFCEGGMGYESDQLMQKMAHLIEQKMYDCLEIVLLATVQIGDMLQYQIDDIDKINYSMDMIEMDRRSRSKASNIIKVSRFNFNGEKLRDHYEKKDYVRFTNLLAAFEEKLKGSFSKKNKILRMVKDLQAISDSNWKNDTGSFGVVEKINAKFRVNSEISINAQTNEELLKIRTEKNNDEISSEVEINDYTSAEGYLVRKQSKDTHSDSSFYVEKRMLAYMRAERCNSINEFFWIENQKLEDISEIYSKYHAEKIDDRLEKSNAIIKSILTLLEGLIFFRWNGISHRDLKPENILKSEDYTAKIIDFGSSCHNKYYRNENNRAKRIFSEKLRTNIHYNLIYGRMDRSAKSNFTENEYNQHQFFDVYAFGIIVEEFLGTVNVKNQTGEVLWEYFRYISQLCKEQNPDDRPDPRNLYVLFAFLIKLTKK